jgi:hypothetical protein
MTERQDALRLLSAPEAQLVVVRRRDGQPLRGFVAGSGRRWLLLQQAFESTLDGYCALRHRDVTGAVVDRRSGTIVRALELRGERPAAVADVSFLGSTTALLAWAAAEVPVVAVHAERRWPVSCHFGTVASVDGDRKGFALRELDADAQWWPEPFSWRYRDLTRLEFGSRYANDLLAVADHWAQATSAAGPV